MGSGRTKLFPDPNTAYIPPKPILCFFCGDPVEAPNVTPVKGLENFHITCKEEEISKIEDEIDRHKAELLENIAYRMSHPFSVRTGTGANKKV